MTLFGAKMSKIASEPIDLDVTDAPTASKRPQWTLPPLSTRSIQPAVAFCRTQGIYSIGGLAKLISLRCSKMAFDHLCIPATSCEAERAFSGCKYTISDHRSRLGEDILEALECDGAWLRAGL